MKKLRMGNSENKNLKKDNSGQDKSEKETSGNGQFWKGKPGKL